MSKRFLTVLALLLLLMTLVVSPILGTVGVVRAEELPVTPQSDTSDPNQVAGPGVWLRALDSLVRPGGLTSFELVVKNVADLYGLSLDLKYDPSLLTLDPVSTTQAVDTSGFYEWAINDYDSGTGEVTLVDLLTGSVPGRNFDDGEWHRLALLKFEVSDAVLNGTLGFSLVPASNDALIAGTAMVKLSNSAGQPIPFTGFGGDVNISADAAIVSGRITAAGSDPIVGLPDVRVELMPMAPDTEPIAAVTNQDGYYECSVPPGEYKLATRTDPWVAAPYAGKYYSLTDQQYNWPEATAFTLASAEEKQINLSLEPGQAISGMVTDAENGASLERIWVHAVRADNGFIYDTCGGSTNQWGEYRLVVPAGSFYIIARGGQMFWDAWYRVGTDNKTAIGTVAGGSLLQGNNIVMDQKATVTVSGTVVDAATEQPLSGVWVDVRSYDEPADVMEIAQTDSNGHYQVSVPAGSYRVLTQDYLSNGIPYAQMFYDANTGSFSWDGAEPLVVGNEPVTGIDFALQPSGWIEGDVKGADGNALPQAIVAAIQPGNPPLRFGSAETNSTGHFKLVVPPGEYAVAAHYPPNHEGYPEVWYPNAIHPELSGRVSVIDAGSTVSDISLKLKPYAGSISGQVLDAENHPITGLPVGAYLAGPQAEAYAMTWTGPNGNYSLSLPAGTYLIGTMAREWQQPFIDEWYDNQADPTTATSLAVSDTASHEDIDLTLSRLPHANLAPSCFFDDNLPASTKIELDPGKLGLTADQTIYYTIRSWMDGSKQNGEISFDFEGETNIYDLPLPNNPVLPSNGAAGYDVTIYSTEDRTGTPLASCNPIVIFPSSSARTLNGTITEAGTEPPVPIVGARVVAEGFGEGHIRFEAFTGELGTYSLRLPGGILYGYRVSVDKKDVFPMLWHSDEGLVGDWGEADPVMVTSTSPEGTTLNLAVPAQMPAPGIGIWPRCIFDDQTAPEIDVWITPDQPDLTEAVTVSYEVLEKTNQTSTDVFGTFNYTPTNANYNIQLGQLDAGTYVIRFSANDKVLAEQMLIVFPADQAGTIDGHVTSGGEDLIGVQVLAEGYDNQDIVFDTFTDEIGDYQLRLPAGDYRIAVQPVVEGPLVWYDNATWEEAQKVSVASASLTNLNLAIGQAAATMTVGRVSGRAGDVVEVPISITGYGSMTSYGITIQYDPAVLTPVVGGAENGDILSSGGFGYNASFSQNEIRLANFQSSASVSGNTIATVKFTINQAAVAGTSTDLHVTQALIYDQVNEQVSVSLLDGSVDIVNVIYGDVTGDGNVYPNDATAVMRYFLGLENFDALQMLAADVTGDGNIYPNDATAILQYFLGLISSLEPSN